VVGVGGTVVPRWSGPAAAWLPKELFWVVGCSYRGLPEQLAPIRNPIGANMSFRREAFELTGGFPDGIGRVGRTPLGCEETEFAIRACRQTGGVVVHVPDAQVEHLVPRERATLSYFCSRCFLEGRSKALVSRRVGAGLALMTERAYARHVLPAGAARALAEALGGDASGLMRALAIVVGLVVTTAGYASERIAGTVRRNRR